MLALTLLLAARPALAQAHVESKPGIRLTDVHAAFGLTALGAFSSALVIGAASGNLGKLMEPERFASLARLHTASNVALVPVLTLAFGDILFE